jgi:pyruvate dehydrogenase E1 component alpha subunit
MSEKNDTKPSTPELDAEHWLQAYEQMAKIRAFEEAANELYTSARMPGITHLYIGEEAIAVGICEALRQDDYITSTHRGHGHCLAKGAALDKMFAELLGKEAGYCRGKGGSMHIADQDTGNLGANGIVGGSQGIATGAGMSIKLRGTDQVAVCFFGDGALGQGLLYESMNMAQLWKLPVIYVCENNQYGEYTPTERVTAGNLVSRGEAFDIPSARVDGMDVMAVYRQTGALVERARRGEGPGFMVCDTYRFRGHGMSDADRPYRTREEEREWMKRDPIERFARLLTEKDHCSREELDLIGANVRAEIDAAVTWAQEAAWPATDEVTTHVYAE